MNKDTIYLALGVIMALVLAATGRGDDEPTEPRTREEPDSKGGANDDELNSIKSAVEGVNERVERLASDLRRKTDRPPPPRRRKPKTEPKDREETSDEPAPENEEESGDES